MLRRDISTNVPVPSSPIKNGDSCDERKSSYDRDKHDVAPNAMADIPNGGLIAWLAHDAPETGQQSPTDAVKTVQPIKACSDEAIAMSTNVPVQASPVEDLDKYDRTPSPMADIPNGGLTAWLQVSGSFVLFVNRAYRILSALSHKSASDIAWIGSFQSFLLLFVGVITGPFFDRGHFRLLVLTGTFLIVLGMMMTSISKEYWHTILSQALLVGIGSGCLFVPSVAVMPTYFTTTRSLATGIAATGSSVGGIIYPIIFHRLQPCIGFGWSTRVIAFIVLASQGFALSVMRIRLKPATKRRLFDKTALTDIPYLTFTMVAFFSFIGVFIPFYYISSFAVQKQIFNEDSAFYMLSLLNAASIFGRIIPNFFADKIGPLNILAPFSLCTMIVAFCWILVSSAAGLFCIAFFYGFFSGAFVSVQPSVLATLSPQLDLIGTRMGMSFAVTGLGLLIGTPVAGALLKTKAGYTGAIALCGASVAVSFVLTIFTRVMKTGWVLRVKA